jgi:hypothetical protein
LLAALEAAKGKLDADQLKRFESAYLDLEVRLMQADLTPEKARVLAQRIHAQQRELISALAAH